MILVTGGTGFVGGNLIRELISNHEIRCLVRDPDRAFGLKDAGCELVRGDVTDPGSMAEAFAGPVDTVIHLVGILAEPRGGTFEGIHVGGTRNVVEACKNNGVKRYLHISALGARAGARSRYHQTKWAAEELIRASGLDYTIFRPSVLFGREDEFTNMFARVMRISPVVFVPGSGKNKMQPLYVKDLVETMARTINMDEAKGKVYEVAGPVKYTFNEILDEIAAAIGKRAFKLHIPMPLMRLGAAVAEKLLPKPPITRDQLLMLEEDNTTDENAVPGVLGRAPTEFSEGMKTYLS